jgi:hypothetical protein
MANNTGKNLNSSNALFPNISSAVSGQRIKQSFYNFISDTESVEVSDPTIQSLAVPLTTSFGSGQGFTRDATWLRALRAVFKAWA